MTTLPRIACLNVKHHRAKMSCTGLTVALDLSSRQPACCRCLPLKRPKEAL